jgi:hypothetical protein
MPTYVRRRYICKKCSQVYQGQNIVVKGGNDPMEPCPKCNVVKAEIIDRPRDIDLRAGPRAKAAVDFTYKMAESDYGMTDMRDNLRAGDLAMKLPVGDVGSAVAKQGGMFGNQGAQQAIQHGGNALQMAAGARAERKAQGIPDPVQSLQSSIKSANAPSIIDSARRGPLGMRAK